MREQTRERISQINRDDYLIKQQAVKLITILIFFLIFMIVPYTFVLSGALSKPVFLTFFISIMFGYLFYVMYQLDIYDFKTIVNQPLRDIESSREYLQIGRASCRERV